MYAVFVIAAILLSVAPMHARTILAALPATALGHQFALDELSESDRQVTRGQLPSATRALARPVRTVCAPDSRTAAPGTLVASWSPRIPAPSLGLLEHAPNAP